MSAAVAKFELTKIQTVTSEPDLILKSEDGKEYYVHKETIQKAFGTVAMYLKVDEELNLQSSVQEPLPVIKLKVTSEVLDPLVELAYPQKDESPLPYVFPRDQGLMEGMNFLDATPEFKQLFQKREFKLELTVGDKTLLLDVKKQYVIQAKKSDSKKPVKIVLQEVLKKAPKPKNREDVPKNREDVLKTTYQAFVSALVPALNKVIIEVNKCGLEELSARLLSFMSNMTGKSKPSKETEEKTKEIKIDMDNMSEALTDCLLDTIPVSEKRKRLAESILGTSVKNTKRYKANFEGNVVVTAEEEDVEVPTETDDEK